MIRKTIVILGRKGGVVFGILTMLIFFGAIIDTALTYIIMPFVSLIMNPEQETDSKTFQVLNNFGAYSNNQKIFYLAIFVAISYVFRNVYMLVLNYLRSYFIARSKAFVSKKLFFAISSKPYSYFTETNTASIQRICVNDVTRLFSVVDSMLQILINSMTLLFILILLMVADPILTIVAGLIMGAMTFGVNRPIAKQSKKLSSNFTEHYTKMLQWTQQFVGSMKTTIVNQKQNFFVDMYSHHIEEFTRNEARYGSLTNVAGYIMNAVVMGIVFTYIAVLAKTSADILSKIPVLALFALAALKLMPCLSTITSLINNIKYNEEGVDIIYNQMHHLISIDVNSINATDYKIEKRIEDGISVENISFKYNDADDYIFRNLNIKIPANKSIAFVGTTGAGKTTLADIILGLHIPQEGKVVVDGKDISENRKWWANQIGYIPQSIYLCEDSIKANVAFGVPEKEIDIHRVEECLKKAQIYDFVQSLPNKENTIAGENGVKLSGGQRQRIGIARALYCDPPFVVMDEATSALDSETEKAIIDTINSLAGQKTLLIIAHRLSTIEKCDFVYKIENGQAILQNSEEKE